MRRVAAGRDADLEGGDNGGGEYAGAGGKRSRADMLGHADERKRAERAQGGDLRKKRRDGDDAEDAGAGGYHATSRALVIIIAMATIVLLYVRQTRIARMHDDIEVDLGCYPTCNPEEVYRHARESASGSHDDEPPAALRDDNGVADAEPDPTAADLESFPLEFFPPEAASTARDGLLMEFGLSGDEAFSSVAEIAALVGHRCPALRHCGHKVATGTVHWGGGQWIEGAFHPHACWLYQVAGSEPWLRQGVRAVERMGILLDVRAGDAGPAALDQEEAASHYLVDAAAVWDRLKYLRVAPPTNFGDEKVLQDRIRQAVLDKLGADASLDAVALTVVAVWPQPGDKALGAARRLLRVANTLPLRSVEVHWALQPFAAGARLASVIRDNQVATETVGRVREAGETAATLARAPIRADALKMLRAPRTVTLETLKAAAGRGVFALVNAGSAGVESDPQEALRRLRGLSQSLPLEAALRGESPNIDPDVNLLVYADHAQAASAGSVGRVLQRHGFRNVLVLRDPATEDFAQVALQMQQEGRLVQLYDHTAPLRGLDLFSATMVAPREVEDPIAWTAVGGIIANLVLNIMYRNEIMGAASVADPLQHLCKTRERCTTCTPQISRFPGSRLSFELITEYLHLWSVPAVVELEPEERVWVGSWQSFFQDNKNVNLTVRSDYQSAKARNFFQMSLGEFLQKTGVVDANGNGIRAGADSSDNAAGSQRYSPPPLYAGNNKLSPAQMRDYKFKYPAWIKRESLQRPSLWTGPDGSFSGLHVDHSNTGNLAYQVLGQKEWHLFPPRASPFMYGRRRGIVIWSQVRDPRWYSRGDHSIKFPDFRYSLLEGIVARVNENEMMYNPPEWWHAVHNTDASLMLNFWVKPVEQLAKSMQRGSRPNKMQNNNNNNNKRRRGN